MSDTTETMSSCTCKKCIALCWQNPGWFGSVEEIEGAARILGKTVEEFTRNFLIREWWAGEEEWIEVPAPRRNFDRLTKDRKQLDQEMKTLSFWPLELRERLRNGPGFVRATWGHNLMTGFSCIFLTEDNLCSIHESKPKECRESFGCERVTIFEGRRSLLKYWKEHQDWIKEMIRHAERYP